VSAIDEMAKRAAEIVVVSRHDDGSAVALLQTTPTVAHAWLVHDPNDLESCDLEDLLFAVEDVRAAIARHYREGVRDLVLAAQLVVSPFQDPLNDCNLPDDLRLPPSTASVERLRKALENFNDIA